MEKENTKVTAKTEDKKVEAKKDEKKPVVTAAPAAPVVKTEAKKEVKAETKNPAAKKPERKKDKPVKKVKTTDVKPAAKKEEKAFVFGKTTFEFGGEKYTEEAVNKLVLGYLKKHPYINAEKIETFVNVEENRIYFTVDGYSNPDFTISLAK